MRIFYAADASPNPWDLRDSTIWWSNLYLPLRDLGHEIVTYVFDYTAFNAHLDVSVPANRRFIEQHRPRASQALLDQIRRAHKEKRIDLFFSYFYSAYVEPEAIREIGELGITTINWYCNGSYQLHLVEEIAPAYHFCLVPERFRLDDYRRLGANPIYCQEAANPNIYKPAQVPVECEVTFAGQKYGTRPMFVNRLFKAGVDVRVWGPGWRARQPRWRRACRHALNVKRWLWGQPVVHDCKLPLGRCGAPLGDTELVAMYSRSKISLGFTTVAKLPSRGEAPIKQVRLRDFEAPMSGAFYLVERCEELGEFFTPDKEIVFFSDADELIDKARYYLVRDTERERIRQAGMRRARGEHTWHHRFSSVFKQIGLQ
jgi:hypothetical protein